MPSLGFQKDNLTVIDEYFYNFLHDDDMLLMVCDDGKIAFTYPFDTVLSDDEEVVSAEWDGNNWWTLQRNSILSDSLIIRRWSLDNYICKEAQTINLNADVSHKYDSYAFSVEHYHATITGSLHSPGSTTIYIDSGYGSLMSTGMTVTLKNSTGGKENIEIHDAGDGWVELADPTTYGYVSNDTIEWYTNIWLLNNYSGIDDSTGALYKINAYLGSYVTHYAGGAYKDIKCCTFCNITLPDIGYVNTFIYLKYRNLLFVDVTGTSSLPYYGSMVLDWSDTDPIVDMAIENDNMYFLYNTDYTLATLTSYIHSIALAASPAIIPANEVSTTTISAVVKDQFNAPVAGRLVTFSEDDDKGELLGTNPANTDIDGRATIIYRSGDAARNVTITVAVDQ